MSCGAKGCADGSHCDSGVDKVLVEQWGSASFDGVYAVTVGASGEPVVAGAVSYALDGLPYAGAADAFVGARGATASTRWSRTNGTVMDDFAVGVAVSSAGELYEAGTAGGKLGAAQLGETDGFAIGRAADHSVSWTTQWGTTARDSVHGMARDSDGNLWVAGETWGALHGSNVGNQDAFVSKLDSTGIVLWSAQWGTSGADTAQRVATDGAGNGYAVGLRVVSTGSPQKRDVVLVKLDSSGNIKWNTSWNSPADAVGRDVIVLASGKLLVVGFAGGSMGGTGSGATFVSVVSAAGVVESTEQFGSNYVGGGYAVVKGSGTDVYVAGLQDGSGVAGAFAGSQDVFLQKRDQSGTVSWTKVFGTLDDERVESVAVSTDGTVYVGGYTYAAFPGYTNAGQWDAFLATVQP